MSKTINEVLPIVRSFIGEKYYLPITKNKGEPGLFLEKLLGIPHTSRHIDLADGEVKLFPIKKLQKGSFSPKESIACTMVSFNNIITDDWKSSGIYTKMCKTLYVSYYREMDYIYYYGRLSVT